MIAQATLKDIEADTVVTEFKTDNNKLSVWKTEDERDIEDAFIALGANCSNIGSISAVKISLDELDGISFDDEEGNTPTIEINQKHRNITDLNYLSLGDVISAVIACLQKEDRVVEKSKAEMRNILVRAYLDNRLVVQAMNPSIVDEII